MKVDPVTTQVLRYRMESIADEMGYTLVRTSRSTVIKEIEDISCAVFDRRGRTIAQGHHAPMLLTGFEFTMAALLERVKDWEEGDVVLSNDPYLGGQHLTDLQTFSPVFWKGKLSGFVGNIAHHSDVGGSAPGTVTGGLTEIFQEGLRLPMVKLYGAGKEAPDIFGILRANFRVPDKTLGDLRAQAAAGFVGARRLKETLDQYGPDVVEGATEALMAHSEARLRAALRDIPDGTYTGEDFVDDDGITEDPIRIVVNVRKKGDAATVDFTGSSPQVKGNLNCPIATAHAAVYYALIAVLDPHVPPNSGCYRPFKVVAEPGLVMNPHPPAAVQARTNTSQKISEATLRALAQALPAKVTAGSHGNIMTNAFAGWFPGTRKRFVCIEIQGGGAGGRPAKDGCDGQDSHLARFMNTPTEAQELEYPLRIERYEFIPDTGGAGKHRGALALRRDVRALADMTFSRYADRQKFPPFGVLGGKPGACGETQINGKKARAKGIDSLKAGDVVSLRTPGAGGYGPPKDRDPQAVRRDVADGKVSRERAKADYGVDA